MSFLRKRLGVIAYALDVVACALFLLGEKGETISARLWFWERFGIGWVARVARPVRTSVDWGAYVFDGQVNHCMIAYERFTAAAAAEAAIKG